jgi:hypothetical protein
MMRGTPTNLRSKYDRPAASVIMGKRSVVASR